MTDLTTVWVAVTSGLGGTLGGYRLAGRNDEARDIRTAQREESLGLRTTPNTYGTNSGYIPEQKYVRALLENLHEMSEDGEW